MIDAGAGRGTLARSILAAEPACGAALDYVAVEISANQRAQQPDGVRSVAQLPDAVEAGVVVANELLDNLPFDVYQRSGELWCELLVGFEAGELVETFGPPEKVSELPDVANGVRLPVISQAADWVQRALSVVDHGRLLVIDYASPTQAMVGDNGGWLRTYRSNERGGDSLAMPGSQDITTQIPIEQLLGCRPLARSLSQAEFLVSCGIEDLVEHGRRVWAERAHLGDLAAIRARSRVVEAEALLEPDGLGGFAVFEWVV